MQGLVIRMIVAGVVLSLIATSSAKRELENVAVHKKATQSSTFSGQDTYNGINKTFDFSASLAVDGAKSVAYKDKTCAMTDYDYSHTVNRRTDYPWWAVNLGGDYEINNIVIYQRDIAKEFLFGPLNVTAGSYHERNADSVQHQKLTLIMPGHTIASSVNISVDARDAILQLCEVEVYAWIVVKECTENSCHPSGTCHEGDDGFTCSCFPGFTGTRCETDIDECSSRPCQNKASCRDQVNSYTCDCQSGYTGVNCQTDIDECSSRPCQNKASCRDQVNSYTCDCQSGYTGVICQTDIDECSSGPCQHGGSCRDHVNSYTCDCPSGYTGVNCQTDFNECASGPCWNNGTCIDALNSYTCNCSDGFLGNFCETNVDECGSDPCQNNGTCIDAVNSYTCNCSDGFSGNWCETDIDECSSNPCENNGTCIDAINGFSCNCSDGFSGNVCETACSGGRYGLGCLKTCSPHCLESSDRGGQHCNHVTGVCLSQTGCKDGFQGVKCEETAPPVAGPSSALIGGIVGGVIVITAVAVALVLWFRRRSAQPKGGSRMPERAEVKLEQLEEAEDVEGHDVVAQAPVEKAESSPDKSVYYNSFNSKPSTRISAAQLPAVVARSRANKEHFRAEYQLLPQGLQHPHTVAVNSYNKGKNRYKNICAYDHSRVVLSTLPGKPHSDYINACYVDGYKKEKEFIASQGPTDVNVSDFVRMIWEKDIEAIAMVTKASEMGKVKCVEYWSDSGNKKIGTITVKVASVSENRDITIRNLVLKQSDGAAKQVTHFLYEAWPDKDVPDSPWSLIDFRDKVMTSRKKANVPILVHCSAGIGRTGTLIALDVILRQLTEEGQVDVYNAVWKLRQFRVDLVQTLAQYAFLHEAALVGLSCGGRVVPMESIASDPVASDRSRIEKEYQALTLSIRTFCDDECSMATMAEHASANRTPRILPPDQSLVWLTTPTENEINYINAVFLPSYTNEKRYILTQTPLPNTVVNFWRLVHQEEVKAIVTLDVVTADAEARVGDYIPRENKPAKFGPLTVKTLRTGKKHGCTLRTLQVGTTEKQAKQVQQYEVSLWDATARVPSDPYQLVSLARAVLSSARATDSVILVHCRDGGRRSGVYVALSTLLERGDSEAEVAVPHAVGVLASVRPQALPSLEQYAFLYAAMLSHADSSTLYENVQPSHQQVQHSEPQEAIYKNAEMLMRK